MSTTRPHYCLSCKKHLMRFGIEVDCDESIRFENCVGCGKWFSKISEAAKKTQELIGPVLVALAKRDFRSEL